MRRCISDRVAALSIFSFRPMQDAAARDDDVFVKGQVSLILEQSNSWQRLKKKKTTKERINKPLLNNTANE